LTLAHGRHSTPVEVILRLLLLKHLYGWSYEATLKRVADSLVLRWFARVYFQTVPTKATLIRWTHTLRPETLHQLNDRVVQLAVQAKVTEGRKVRLDATWVQTEIHHPPDSGRLFDSVRVLSRIAQKAKGLLKEQVKNVHQLCRSRVRTARQTAQTLHRGLRRKGEAKEAEQRKVYEKLVETPEQMGKQPKRLVNALQTQTQQPAQRLVEQVEQMLPLVERVSTQTRKRVVENKKVPSSDKVLSLFEPHTRAMPRHKGGAWVEFGRLVTLDEVEGGLVTRYQILEHPEAHGQAIDGVAHHREVFARPPRVVAADRGVHSADTAEKLKTAGVKQVALPAVGQASQERRALERTPAFRRG